MNVSDAISRIQFKVGDNDDNSSRAINPIVSVTNIIKELNVQLQQYANKTKGIQDVYSVPVTTTDQFISAPQYALRSLAYNYAYMIIKGMIFPLDFRSQRDVLPIYRYAPIRGITSMKVRHKGYS
jgi:hypothetical protein